MIKIAMINLMLPRLKPNKTVLRLVEFYLMSWAKEDELLVQLTRLKAQA